MPKTSNIQLLKEFALYMGFDSLISEDPLLNEDEVFLFLSILENSRVAQSKSKVPKSMEWYFNILCTDQFNEDRFRCQLRMDRESFNYLLELLKGNESYNCTQDPQSLQIAVGLHRFGTYGNSAGLKHIATKFGICEGSVHNFTARFVNALCSIKGTWIRWPNAEERRSLAMSYVDKYLPKCIGFVDGSDVPLSEAPIDNRVYYWSRKKRYSIQFQIVCDKDKLIRDFFTGYPGSVHDAKVFTSSPFGRNLEDRLTNGQFVIGDSAYPISRHLIVPFKRRGGNLTPERRIFNRHISSHRVAVEHTIGILKGRFQSLTELRVRVSEEKGHRYACKWIEACCVLHNILTLKDPWNREADVWHWEPEEEQDNHNQLNERNNERAGGEQKRLALLQIINAMII